MVLAIGLVVDDAIIVGEQIHRHQASGQPGLTGAIAGARQVAEMSRQGRVVHNAAPLPQPDHGRGLGVPAGGQGGAQARRAVAAVRLRSEDQTLSKASPRSQSTAPMASTEKVRTSP